MASSQTNALQESLFAQMADAKRHPHVSRIDTHASVVFLEDERALKIKRAVRFPFLDYSTLDKRKAACDEEIRINRPFAPQIYRRVTPITQTSDGSFEIDGPGVPVEYAVEMARFDESKTIDNLVRTGQLPPDIPELIADAVAASHATAPAVLAKVWTESIEPIIEDNNAAFLATARLRVDDVEDLRAGSISSLQSLQSLLEERGHLGYVLRCHGDLHLGNIVLLSGKPVLFDAIEFDLSIASVDVLYDLAFPIMDFVRYGRFTEANTVFNRYLQITPDDHLVALSALPLFISLRAAVRAKVLLAQPRMRPDIGEAAYQYFTLACQAIRPPPPKLVAVGGLSGTGKSVLARGLAPGLLPHPGAVVLRTDVIRKQIFNVSEKDQLPDDAYRPEILQHIYGLLAERALRILRQGHSVVLDGVFAKIDERNAVRKIAQDLDVEFAGYFLKADLKTRIDRISRRTDDASDATPQIAQAQENYATEVIDWKTVDAGGTPEQTLAACRYV